MVLSLPPRLSSRGRGKLTEPQSLWGLDGLRCPRLRVIDPWGGGAGRRADLKSESGSRSFRRWPLCRRHDISDDAERVRSFIADEVRGAGEVFDQRSGDRSWKIYSVERRQWPIYNWIDDYVVVLNQ